jgi:hypothetical protein
VNEVHVQELGLQTGTDESGETISYYAIGFSLDHEGRQFGMVKSLDPDTVPGDMEYLVAIENGKRSLLAKALQDGGDQPAEQATGQ